MWETSAKTAATTIATTNISYVIFFLSFFVRQLSIRHPRCNYAKKKNEKCSLKESNQKSIIWTEIQFLFVVYPSLSLIEVHTPKWCRQNKWENIPFISWIMIETIFSLLTIRTNGEGEKREKYGKRKSIDLLPSPNDFWCWKSISSTGHIDILIFTNCHRWWSTFDV